jgi:hypothetical protein
MQGNCPFQAISGECCQAVAMCVVLSKLRIFRVLRSFLLCEEWQKRSFRNCILCQLVKPNSVGFTRNHLKSLLTSIMLPTRLMTDPGVVFVCSIHGADQLTWHFRSRRISWFESHGSLPTEFSCKEQIETRIYILVLRPDRPCCGQ